MSAAAVRLMTQPDDRVPFPTSHGYDGDYGAYTRAAFDVAVIWATQILETTTLASARHARLYALSELAEELGREPDQYEWGLAERAMTEGWAARPTPLALVPDPAPTHDVDLVAMAEAESADWSDFNREIL